MQTDDCLRRMPSDTRHFRLGFGQDILERMAAIRRDIEIGGVPGLLSLIQALIAGDEFVDHQDLLRWGSALCSPDMCDVFTELLSNFEGDDPLRNLWIENSGGFYRLTGNAHDRIH